jgi:hypothetical protein
MTKGHHGSETGNNVWERQRLLRIDPAQDGGFDQAVDRRSRVPCPRPNGEGLVAASMGDQPHGSLRSQVVDASAIDAQIVVSEPRRDNA